MICLFEMDLVALWELTERRNLVLPLCRRQDCRHFLLSHFSNPFHNNDFLKDRWKIRGKEVTEHAPYGRVRANSYKDQPHSQPARG